MKAAVLQSVLEPAQELSVYGMAEEFFARQGKNAGILAGFRGFLTQSERKIHRQTYAERFETGSYTNSQ